MGRIQALQGPASHLAYSRLHSIDTFPGQPIPHISCLLILTIVGTHANRLLFCCYTQCMQFAFEFTRRAPRRSLRRKYGPRLCAYFNLCCMYPFLWVWAAFGCVWYARSHNCLDQESMSGTEHIQARRPHISACLIIEPAILPTFVF